jgi:hypothetical protein
MRLQVHRLAAYGWALPTTAVGLAAGALTLVTGGAVRACAGTLEFHGGFATWMLRSVARARAMTLGHVILGRDPLELEICRAHELAHVRQVERWGPLFLPAYLACSAWEWAHRAEGRHYYYDNYFERDARRACGEDLADDSASTS